MLFPCLLKKEEWDTRGQREDQLEMNGAELVARKENRGCRRGKKMVAGKCGSSLGCDCGTDNFSSSFFIFCSSLHPLSLFSGL